jgi:hypothetical protein
VDRHCNQLAALQMVWPNSRIAFCSKHLDVNIRRAVGNHLQILVAFWEFMKGKISEEQFAATLKLESTMRLENSLQQRKVRFFSTSLDYLSLHWVQNDIFDQVDW